MVTIFTRNTVKTPRVKQCGIAKAIKNGTNETAIKLLWDGYDSIVKADLNHLDHTTSAEDLNLRKAVFFNYRFWMRDVKTAEETNKISRREAIDLATVMRSAAVIKIGRLRQEHPAQPEVIEVVECDETGRPVIEVQAEIIAELQSSLDEANTALEQAATTIVDATKQIEARNVEIKQLKRENRSLSTKLRTISKATQAYNKAIKVR